MRIAQNSSRSISWISPVKLGVLCGIEREAAIIRTALADKPHQIICTGARSENAAAGATTLVSNGATHLISFGLAGALADDLRPGDLLLPACIIDVEERAWTPDTGWHDNMRKLTPAAQTETLLGIDHPVRTAAQKLFLRGTLDAASVDMESHFVARAAAKAGLPFLVLRAVADDHRTTLPMAAMEAVSPEGKEQPLNAVKALLRRPSETAALIRLGLASGKGFRSLRRAAGLGFGV
jgi:adenosylhomocysteine nucleosidase